ncbi:hypothetical protein F0L68_38960 [Solihabitans fulvus]|uniref:DUF4345 domain-containing protein n=1 Tax=Solihabitans fulvus TaxID=1892852 RepID=A0A5B2WJ82_9PSEU|nr:hypothetical protein [Solihabitans fulvus]KAA2250127.1 hypothetical protein F0L68_38960 [Solihabitans fulvus]
MIVVRLAAAACLAVSGYVHADLYVHGYRGIPGVGPAFLVQAAASFALAALLLAGGAGILRLMGVGLAASSLVGFVLSRTVGVFGFVERGFQPAPQAVVSVLVEVAVLGLLVPSGVVGVLRWRAGRAVRAAG